VNFVAKFYTAKEIQLNAISLMDVMHIFTVNILLTFYTKKSSFVKDIR